ncbi:hypothetical protein BGZ68_005045 [Mortierella alpina]|nr:hypothetical protein BGZ68_005045 [Mortierella alpina]
MHISFFSALTVLALGVLHTEAVTSNVVRIDPKSNLICLILPPRGKLVGPTETEGLVHCTDGKPRLLPSNFFVAKKFLVTKDYVQAWGLMNDNSVGLLKKDGGGQYDTHMDSGHNTAVGYPAFVELLEPDTGRWCIRFCHEKGPHCNYGKSTYGCEGALGITDWPTPSHHSSDHHSHAAKRAHHAHTAKRAHHAHAAKHGHHAHAAEPAHIADAESI